MRPEPCRESGGGPSVPVAAGDVLVATQTMLRDDETGVRVSVDWQGTDHLSRDEARGLADAQRQVADLPGPQLARENASIAPLADVRTGLRVSMRGGEDDVLALTADPTRVSRGRTARRAARLRA